MKNLLANISSVSSAIKSFAEPSLVEKEKAHEINEYDGFRIEIANTVSKLMDAAHLSYHGYLKKGFVEKSELPFIFNEWDVSGLSVCLLAYDKDDKCVGTMTVVPDFNHLPVDITFNKELNELRGKGHKLCEFTRFIIDEDFRNQKSLLTALMEWASIVTETYFHGSDIIVEVNPRHQMFYLKKLLFAAETGIKNCPLVNNAPAILLRLPIKTCLEYRDRNDTKISIRRLLYSGFISHTPSELSRMTKYILRESKKIKSQLSLEAYMGSHQAVKVS